MLDGGGKVISEDKELLGQPLQLEIFPPPVSLLPELPPELQEKINKLESIKIIFFI